MWTCVSGNDRKDFWLEYSSRSRPLERSRCAYWTRAPAGDEREVTAALRGSRVEAVAAQLAPVVEEQAHRSSARPASGLQSADDGDAPQTTSNGSR